MNRSYYGLSRSASRNRRPGHDSANSRRQTKLVSQKLGPVAANRQLALAKPTNRSLNADPIVARNAGLNRPGYPEDTKV